MKRFATFCELHNIHNLFPLTELLLCYYASYLADQGLAPQTVKAYLAAVRSEQIKLGLPDPRDQSSLSLLKRIQAGINRVQKGQAKQRVRLPITPPILCQIKTHLTASNNAAVGGGHFSILWLLSPRRDAARVNQGVCPYHRAELGRCGSRQPPSASHGADSPKGFKMRPVRWRCQHRTGSNR